MIIFRRKSVVLLLTLIIGFVFLIPFVLIYESGYWMWVIISVILVTVVLLIYTFITLFQKLIFKEDSFILKSYIPRFLIEIPYDDIEVVYIATVLFQKVNRITETGNLGHFGRVKTKLSKWIIILEKSMKNDRINYLDLTAPIRRNSKTYFKHQKKDTVISMSYSKKRERIIDKYFKNKEYVHISDMTGEINKID